MKTILIRDKMCQHTDTVKEMNRGVQGRRNGMDWGFQVNGLSLINHFEILRGTVIVISINSQSKDVNARFLSLN